MSSALPAGDKALAAVLFDGWPLVYSPNHPAALHLLTVLEAYAQASGTPGAAWVALPGDSFHRLPPGANRLLAPTPHTPAGRLAWEQRTLPRLARQSGAARLHQIGGGLALLDGPPALYSPADFPPPPGPPPRRSFTARLDEALRQGGLARANRILWPDDLPGPAGVAPTRILRLPPGVHPAFTALPQPGALDRLALPDAYGLYHGPADPASLHSLLDAWSWAAEAVGEAYPLLLVGFDAPEQANLAPLVAEQPWAAALHPLPPLSLAELAALYQGCSALFQPVESPVWGDPLRLALATGKPVVGLETARTVSLIGPAGYLISPGGAAAGRLLGAALISVLLDDALAANLSTASLERAAAWDWDRFVTAVAAEKTFQ